MSTSEVFNTGAQAVKRFFKNERQIWLSFLIPSVILLGAYLIFGVYPVGKNSVLSLDLNAQYSFYFAYMKDVLAGKESLFYSWSRNLSGEFMGIIGYYLASPFNFIVWLFPLSHLTEGLLVMILAKIGTIGVTMSIYLSKSRNFSKTTTVIFSIMYALTSYNLEQTMNPMWLDGVMALPLVAMGIEALLREGRYKLLIFSLVYSFVTCFYIGYMVGLFTALYFVYYAFSSRRFNKTNIVVLLKRTGLFAACALIAVLCSCFMLLPVYSALSMGKLTFSQPDFSIRESFTILDISRKLLPNSYDTCRPEGMPFLYTGTLALLTLPVYFFCRRVRPAKRISGAVLIGVIIACMYVKPVDMLWHGGQTPNWLPYRYSFALCFLIAAFGAEGFEHISKTPSKRLITITLVLTGLMIYLESRDTFMPNLGSAGREVLDGITVILPALAVLAVLSAFLLLAKNKLRKSAALGIVLTALVGVELFYNALSTLYKQNQDITYSTRDSFNSVILPTREVADRIQKQDPGFYRMEKTYYRSACDPMALGMKGITHSSSLLNEKAIALLNGLGYSAFSHASRYSGATPLTDDLFGFKYVLSCEKNKTSYIKSADDITVRQNHNVMPLAYLAEQALEEYEFNSENPFLNQNRLLSDMLGEETVDYFKRIPEDDMFVAADLRYKPYADGYNCYEKVGETKNQYIEWRFTAEDDGEYFMYLPSEYERECDLKINGVEAGQYFEGDNHYIKSLGFYLQGETFTVSLHPLMEKVFFKAPLFMKLDSGLLSDGITRLQEKNADTAFEAVSNTRLRITVNAAGDSLLFTSIPFEPGWTVKIDGKKITHIEIMGGLIGADVPQGVHVIEMTFFPNYLPLGLSLTFLGASMIVLINSFLRSAGKERSAAYTSDDYDGNK